MKAVPASLWCFDMASDGLGPEELERECDLSEWLIYILAKKLLPAHTLTQQACSVHKPQAALPSLWLRGCSIQAMGSHYHISRKDSKE